jgi:hypothetical protein
MPPAHSKRNAFFVVARLVLCSVVVSPLHNPQVPAQYMKGFALTGAARRRGLLAAYIWRASYTIVAPPGALPGAPTAAALASAVAAAVAGGDFAAAMSKAVPGAVVQPGSVGVFAAATRRPTPEPSPQPRSRPTRRPRPKPTRRPLPRPTRQPQARPTPMPSAKPGPGAAPAAAASSSAGAASSSAAIAGVVGGLAGLLLVAFLLRTFCAVRLQRWRQDARKQLGLAPLPPPPLKRAAQDEGGGGGDSGDVEMNEFSASGFSLAFAHGDGKAARAARPEPPTRYQRLRRALFGVSIHDPPQYTVADVMAARRRKVLCSHVKQTDFFSLASLVPRLLLFVHRAPLVFLFFRRRNHRRQASRVRRAPSW